MSAGDPANTYFGSYREVFARDLYETFTGLLAAGDSATARATVRFLFDRQQQADGSMPRNSLLNGKTAPDSFGTQLDETAYPDPDGLAGRSDRRRVTWTTSGRRPTSSSRTDRRSGWSGGRSRAASRPRRSPPRSPGWPPPASIADANGAPASARVYRATADDMPAPGQGLDRDHQRTARRARTSSGCPRPATRTRPSPTAWATAAPTLDQRTVIDAGFLELSRLGVLPPTDTDIVRSLSVVDATIRSDTATGPDGTGTTVTATATGPATAGPWAPTGQGTGHLWPVLSGERGEYALQVGDAATAAQLLRGMANFASGVDLIPEQNWELPDLAPSPYGTDPTIASIGFRNGGPAGSAAPLTWSAAQFVRLVAGLGRGRNPVETPRVVADRYVEHRPPAAGDARRHRAGRPQRGQRHPGDRHRYGRPGRARSTY